MSLTDLFGNALIALANFGPRNTATDLLSVITDLQQVRDNISMSNDEAMLNDAQSYFLPQLESSRGRAAGLYPDFAGQWTQIEDLLAGLELAVAIQQAAIPNPSQATLETIESLLQALLQKVDASSPIEQLADLEARTMALEQQMDSLAQQQQLGDVVRALQAATAKMQTQLTALFSEFDRDKLQEFQGELIDFLSGDRNEGELLVKESELLATADGLERLRWAIARQCTLGRLPKLVDFVNLVDSGMDEVSVAPNPDLAASLRQGLMKFLSARLVTAGHYTPPQSFWMGMRGLCEWAGGTLSANVVLGHLLVVSSSSAGQFSGVVTSATLTPDPNAATVFRDDPALVRMEVPLILTMTVTGDNGSQHQFVYETSWWKDPATNQQTSCMDVTCNGQRFTADDWENAIMFHSDSVIKLGAAVVKRDVDPNSYLADAKTVLADVGAALRATPGMA